MISCCFNKFIEKCNDCRLEANKVTKVQMNSKDASNNLRRPSQESVKISLSPSKESRKKYSNKRFRSAFTTNQLSILEHEFKKDAYVHNLRREELASKLRLSERTIKIWFQNRRMKEKRENGQTTDTEEATIKTKNPIVPKIIENLNKQKTEQHKRKEPIQKPVSTHNPTTTDENKNKEKIKNNSILFNIQSGIIKPTKDLKTPEISSNIKVKEPVNTEEQLSNNSVFNPELSTYYSAIANQSMPWDPYLMPAVGNPLSKYAFSINPNISNPKKCNCNCHDGLTQNALNFQPYHPLFYTHYLPHILSSLSQNSSLDK